MTSWTARVIAEELDHIVEVWESLVRARFDVLRDASKPVVQNHVHDVLRSLAAWVETRDATSELDAFGKSHGVQRVSHGLLLRDLVQEHRLLRETVAAVLAERDAAEPAAAAAEVRRAELVRLHEGLDVVVAGAVERYSAVRADAHTAVQDRLRLAIAASGIGAWDYDPALGFFEVDARARALFGLVDEDRPFRREEILEHLDGACRADLERALATSTQGPVRDMRIEVLVHDGEPTRAERWIKLDGRPLLDERGAVVRVLGAVLDVTEHRQLERTRDRFLAVLGHDLRSPLNAIAMAAHLLAGNAEPRQTATIAARVANSVRRMEALIRDLLDFTRAAVGTPLPVSPRPTSIDAVCRKVLDEVRGGHPGAPLVYHPGDPPEGVWDAARLEQVIANLLTNAIKYGRKGAPVTLRWSREPAGGLVLEVHNEGEPIPEELRPHIFDAFRMGEQRGGAGQPSAGVGLYVVAQIVRAHRGEVIAESTPEAGTTFRVRIPGPTSES